MSTLFFGATSYYVTALLFEHWNLEPLYIDMLKGLDYKHKEDSVMDRYIDTLKVIRTAINVRDVLTEKSISRACAMVEEMDLDSEHFRHIAKRIKKHYYEKL